MSAGISAGTALLIGAGTAAAGAVYSASQSRRAGEQAAQASREGAALEYEATMAGVKEQRRQFDQTRRDMRPWMKTGKWALSRQRRALGQLGALYGGNPGLGDIPEYRKFTADDMYDDPGYQFRLKQGEQAVSRGQAARGNFFSGAGLAELAQYNQDMASQEFAAARQRHREDYATSASRESDMYNRRLGLYNTYLQGIGALSGTGQGTASTLGQLGSQTAGSIAGLYQSGGQALGAGVMGAGQARAAGTAGAGQAWGSGLGNIANTGLYMYGASKGWFG